MWRRLILSVCVVFVLGVVNGASADILDLKVDIGGYKTEGSPGFAYDQVVKPGWTEWSGPWLDPGPNSVQETFGNITMTLTRSGGNGLAFRNRVEDPNGPPLTNDLVCIDNLLAGDMGAVTLTISGLATGEYTMTTYHNYVFQGTCKIDIQVDDVSKVDGLQTSLWAENDDVASSATFDFAATGADVVVEFISQQPGQNIPFNGFYLTERVRAGNPNPADDAVDVCPDAVLSWRPGALAVSHDVYFGADFNDVNDATTVDNAYMGNVDVSYYPESGSLDLELSKTYYWRVDEVNESDVWKGHVWTFTTNDGTAFGPNPEDGAILVPINTVLSWSGCLANSHDVFLGTDFNDVNSATTSSHPNVDYNNVSVSSYDPCGLEYLTGYYWRVDEIGDSDTWRGEVWSFRTRSAIFDPNLLLWYKLDETDGNNVADSSGRDFHGDADDVDPNDQNWEPENGHFDGCLLLDNDMAVLVPNPVTSNIGKEISVSVWVNGLPEQDPSDDQPIFDGGNWGNDLLEGHYKVTALVPSEGGGVAWRAGNDSNDVLEWEEATPGVWRGEWHHFGFVKDENADTMGIYFDGVLAESKSGTTSSLINVVNKVFKIGAYNENRNDYRGRLDDFRLYDRALSALEIAGLFRGGDFGSAWGPKPRDGEQDVARDVVLSWRAGNYAVSHNVYFGTDWDDVNDADTSSDEFKNNQEPNEYDPFGLLDLDTTYYWRIDEVNEANSDSPWKGHMWSFTVANFLVIDDMESYNQTDNWIHETWLDGFENSSGSEVYVGVEPTNPAHGGDQSMVYLYYDDGGMWDDLDYYSEIEVDTSMLLIGPDWTEGGVKILTLFFDGNSTNDANERMYVVLEDTGGTYAQVDYGYYADEDMNDIKEEEWQQWDMALSDFSGVDANNVKKVYIGFGVRGNPNPGGTPGGSGFVYFDDIRLYLPKCIPWRLKPAYDFSNDCVVDLADVGEMADYWLRRDRYVDTDEPNSPVVHYEFNETSGSTVEDSGSDYDGVAKVDDVNTIEAFWETDGRFGGCIRFEPDEKAYCIQMPTDAFSNHITNQITISVWVNWDDPDTMPGQTNQLFSMHGGPGDTYKGILGIQTTWQSEKLRFWDANEDTEWEPREDDWAGGWNHYAFVKHVRDVDDGYLRIYHNSELAEESDSNAPMDFPADNAWIGMATDDVNDWHDQYTGLLDDFKVYDYALSEAEIGWLASVNTGYIPLVSAVNIYDKEPQGSKAVNFRDLAELMHSWGEEKVWPQE